MNQKTLELARASGFVFWEAESWRPEGAEIDWSCDYDNELEEFKMMVVRECAYVVQSLVDHRVPASEYRDKLLNYWKK